VVEAGGEVVVGGLAVDIADFLGGGIRRDLDADAFARVDEVGGGGVGIEGVEVDQAVAVEAVEEVLAKVLRQHSGIIEVLSAFELEVALELGEDLGDVVDGGDAGHRSGEE
jgi:hypothetical protein